MQGSTYSVYLVGSASLLSHRSGRGRSGDREIGERHFVVERSLIPTPLEDEQFYSRTYGGAAKKLDTVSD